MVFLLVVQKLFIFERIIVYSLRYFQNPDKDWQETYDELMQLSLL